MVTLDTGSINGIVDRLLYHNKDNSFTVFIVKIAQQKITVKGYVPNIVAGQEISLTGTWSMHSKFGKQFDAQSYEIHAPSSIIGLKKYLGSGLIKGIGPIYAEKLVNYFGKDVLTIIDKYPDKLNQVPGIGQKRVEKIIIAWKDQKEVSNIMVFLQSKDISPTYAAKIYKFYKTQAIAIIEENPYRLAQDIWGIGFKTADQIAIKSGIDTHCKKRISAAILHVIQTTAQDGNLYIELEQLKTLTTQLLELSLEKIAEIIKESLHNLYNDSKIKLISYNNIHYITLPSFYFSEKGIAYKLVQLQNFPSRHTLEMSTIIEHLKTTSSTIQLNENQQKGIIACLENKITIITGGPGTGKTTLIKQLLHILENNKIKYSLAAPTGRAAKRITESTGRVASTLHRLLDFDVSIMNFTRNENNALPIDFLIIDEASMIDVFLAYALIKALPLHAHLILIGDTDQLPSVGAGNFLQDLIASNTINTIRLEHIFRQSQNSLIVINAHRINKGEFPLSSGESTKKDFIFIKENNPEHIIFHLEDIYKTALSRNNILPENSIVLTPMHRGIAGTQKLNHDLQNILNKQTITPITIAGTHYYPQDRVMQLRNNYDKNVFNGDIGTIKKIDHENKIIEVQFFERIVEYETSDLNELTHAYAISIHKSQGSEFDAVIILLFKQHFMMLQRNLLYTAITRAKKLCIFIGEAQAIGMAINNKKNSERITFLQQFLTSDLQCR